MAKTEVKKQETPKEEKLEVKETEVTNDGAVKQQEVSGEVILNGGKDSGEKDPTEGIDEKSGGAKEMLDIQKKAEEGIKDGTSGLDPISVAEVNNGLVKDYLSDRPVYETNSAYLSALAASGKMSGE